VRFVPINERADIGKPAESFPAMSEAMNGKRKQQGFLRECFYLCLTNLYALKLVPERVGIHVDRPVPRGKIPMNINNDFFTIGKILSAIKSQNRRFLPSRQMGYGDKSMTRQQRPHTRELLPANQDI